MNRFVVYSLIALSSATLAGCEAFANGTWMQDGGSRAGRLALVSLSVEGLGNEAGSAEAMAMLQAMQFHAEEALNSQFEVIPANTFAAQAAYRKNATAQPSAAGVTPTIDGHALASFASDADSIRTAQIPGDVVAQLAVDLKARYIAVVHTKWGTKMIKTDEIAKVYGDGRVAASNDVETYRKASIATTTLTIYRRAGTVLVRETREAIGGMLPLSHSVQGVLADKEQRNTVINAFTKGVAQVTSELHQKPGGIEHRPH